MRAVTGFLSAITCLPLAAVAQTTAKVPDVLSGAVDPYDQAAQRVRFFAAARADNELDANEFAADKAKADPFVRSYDRWGDMRTFDKDRNGAIDWFEADAYRQDLRGRVMKAYDADGDGKLAGAEREKANAALAAGNVPPLSSGEARPVISVARPSGPGAGGGAGGRGSGGGGNMGWWGPSQEDLKKYDKDGDGQLNAEERGEMFAGRMRAEVERRRAEVYEKYDTNKDGRIDPEEKAAMVRAIEKEVQARRDEWATRWADRDGDGKLSDEERKAMEDRQAAMRKRMEEWRERALIRRYDADGDGKLSDDERKAMEAGRAAEDKQAQERREKWELKIFDLNSDGKLDDQEQVLRDAADALRRGFMGGFMRGPGGGGPGPRP